MVRATVFFDAVRADVAGSVLRETILFCAVREMVFSSRTAPLAMPTAAISVAMNIQTFLIR